MRGRVPMRTFGDWQDPAPSFVDADLVAHCGPSCRSTQTNANPYLRPRSTLRAAACSAPGRTAGRTRSATEHVTA